MNLVKPLLACGLALFVSLPALGQSRRAIAGSLRGRLRSSRAWQGPVVVVRGQPPGARPRQPRLRRCTGHTGTALGPPTAAPAAPAPPGGGRGGFPPPATLTNQTIRQIVRASVGGSSRSRRVEQRLRHRARRDWSRPCRTARQGRGDRGPIREAADFERQSRLTGSCRAPRSSPIPSISPCHRSAIWSSICILPGDLGIGPSPVTTHNGASQTNYVSETGNHSGEAALPVERRAARGSCSRAWRWPRRQDGAVVTFGDSITDGARSTADTEQPLARSAGAPARGAQGAPRSAVLNAGISGNRVLGDGAGVSALARFDRDVLMQTGVTHVDRHGGHQRHRHRAQQPDRRARRI